MRYSKGVETRGSIICAATELFYEVGYQATTVRQIFERANTNLGLMKYYFNSKAEMAQIVYRKVRDGFDSLIDVSDLRPDTADMFLFSSALELYLCLKSRPYGRFYCEISGESAVRTRIEGIIAEVLMKYALAKGTSPDAYVILACTSIAAIKPAIVGYVTGCPPEQAIPTEACLHYYLQQQLHFLGEDIARSAFFVDLLKRYYIAVADNFTPVMVKTS
ncbi:MAG: TetR/AcrR family transcriptional regulator [Oscillospiraceae bacterium]|nr:TetR/AcrR family transcriptional regulator [Oscillospiraceae bacterium]